MEHDWEDLMWGQSVALADLLDEVPDEHLTEDSLCAGWQVRDVIGHMLVGHTTPMPQMVMAIAKHGFKVPKASREASKAMARSMTPEQLRAAWRTVAEEHTRKGISKVIPYREGFLDHFVHEHDIRRPLGMTWTLDAARLVPALDATVAVKNQFFAPAKRAAGLRFEATDVDWASGEGSTVRGPGEALVMAAGGRAVALSALEGDGVDLLAGRMG